MSLFDKIFGNKKQPIGQEQWFQLLNGYIPVFRSWNGDIYERELVRASIDARARHISKLDVTIVGTAKKSLQSKLKLAPNEWQTWSQFFYRTSSILDVYNTAFIVPVIDEYGDTTGVYPILPLNSELIQYKGVPYIKFHFTNGETGVIELINVGILTKFQLKNDLFGESNSALTPTMELINIQDQGIAEGVKSAASYRFMATATNFRNPEDLIDERKKFSRENLEKGGGILLFPNTFKDIKQIDSNPFIVDAEQMNIIQRNVYNYFGVNEDVLQNKAYGDSWSAFYEGAIEPFAKQFSEVMTKMLFTLKERQQGTSFYATSDKLQYMSNADKLNVSAQMADRGLMTVNEIRGIWNLPPLEGGDVRPVRGEYYHLDDNGNVTGEEQ